MRIAVGSDHAGYEGPPPFYKPAIIEHLQSRGIEVIDCGTNGGDSVDYPDFADKVCETITAGGAERGVLLCGTGMGISIAANRHRGIRAAVCVTPQMAELARTHNDANVICLGRRVLTLDECRKLVDVWLDTPFSGGERHLRRIGKMG
jgi:ribose 5-phosphate isomerase B